MKTFILEEFTNIVSYIITMKSQFVTLDKSNGLFNKKLILTLEDFEILNIIGKGSQEEVYEAQSRHFS